MKKMIATVILLLSLVMSALAEETCKAPSVISVGYTMQFSTLAEGWRTPDIRAAKPRETSKNGTRFSFPIDTVTTLKVLEVCPVSEKYCKIVYTGGLTEYIKKGDVFYYRPDSEHRQGTGAYICTVTSFDYNKIFLDTRPDENGTINKIE